MELTEYVGNRIRELRTRYAGGQGISQEMLAMKLATTANTISRWETGTYKPSLVDLDNLSRFFGISILDFFPRETPDKDTQVAALLRAAKELPKEDIEELRRYAEFRRARVMHGPKGKPRPGRKHSDDQRSSREEP